MMNFRTVPVRLIAIMMIFATAQITTAQEVMMMRGGPAGGVFFIHELGVIAGANETDETRVEVIAVLPNVERERPLKKGDLIFMVNGERVRKLDTLRDAYENASIGDEVKLGFKRDSERFLMAFARAEKPQGPSGPGGRRMMMAGPGNEFSDLMPVHELHVVVAGKDDEVVVAMVMMPGDLEKDDQIVAINGKPVVTFADFQTLYEGVAIGDDLSFKAIRGDGANEEEVLVMTIKADAPAGMMIQRSID